MMSIADIEKIKTVLGYMIQYELDLSDFYRQCAETWTEEQGLWQKLAHAEVGHAENIRKIREIILKKPERFELGRPFNPIALKTAMAGLKENARRMTLGDFSFEKILIIAGDIEQSVLESHYAEIVTTADIEYQTLMKGIVSQTYEHKKTIQKKLSSLKS